MDRWSIVSTLNYLSSDHELDIVLSKLPSMLTEEGKKTIARMIGVADLTRNAFINGDISTVMSPRTLITWAENSCILDDIDYAFKLTFLNKCDEAERGIISEYFQRCFARDLPKSWTNFNDSDQALNNV